ncbi:hypothetical protein K0U27_04160 [archaeon]|nr:hypothetical protein [archaeon]
MNDKDAINGISGTVAIAAAVIILWGIIAENDSIMGFPNAMMLYLLLPMALIWFGTRKNGCGSCNQSCSIAEQGKKEKEF